MAETTRNLKLIIPTGASADTRYNLLKIDTLAGTGVFNLDMTQSVAIQAIGSVNLIPNSPDLGGTGVGGDIFLGQSGQGVTAQVNGELQATTSLGALDQAVGGNKYLRVKYNSALDGSVDTSGDRSLSVDLQGADRNLILGGNLKTNVSFEFMGTAGQYTFPGSGDVVTVAAAQTFTNKTISASSNTLSDIRDASIASNAAISLSKLASLTADRAVQTSSLGVLETSVTSATELGYLAGTTSSVQSQLDAKQASSTELTALAALSSQGIMVRLGANTYATRTIVGTAGDISVTAGDGLAGNPTLSLPTTTVGAGSYGSATAVGVFTVDNKGRLTAATSTNIQVTNAQVATGAAIAGSKISPDFGAQNIKTSGQLQLASGANSVNLVAPVLSTDSTYTLPAAPPGVNGYLLSSDTSGNLAWLAPSSGGTVTSVGLSMPSIFSTAGTPVTTSGTLSVSLNPASQNYVFAGPVSGGAGTPAFRVLSVADLPTNIPLSSLSALSANFALQSSAGGVIQASSVTSTELGYLSGATSNIQTQLDAKQAASSNLTAIAAVNTNGALTRTGTGSYAARTLTAGSLKIVVTNGDGVAGNPTVDADQTQFDLNSIGGVLSVAKGGTNSTTALNNNRLMTSSAGAIVELAAITGSRALVSNSSGLPVASTVTSTELGYVSGVTSNIQTQLDGKQNATGYTANRAVITDGSGTVTTSTTTATEIGYVNGVTSSIQTQLDGKQATGNYITALTGEGTATGPGSASLTLVNSAVIGKVLTGFTAGAGTVSATDSILQAFQKLAGNQSGFQPTGNYITALTGEVTASGPGSAAATVTNAAVIGKVLTGFSASAGTVSATDSILQGFNKVVGNQALYLPLAGGTMTGGLVLSTAAVSGSGGGNVSPASNQVANGNFDNLQRTSTATAVLVSSGGAKACLERWSTMNSQAGSHSQQAWSSGGTHPGNSAFVLRVAGDGATSMRMNAGQAIENSITVGLRGKYVTLSGYVRFSSATLTGAGNFSATIGYTNGTANAAFQTNNYQVDGSASQTFTNGSLPTTWTFFQATVLVGSSANNIAANFLFANLTTLSSSNYYELSLVTLNEGASPAPWSYMGSNYVEERLFCQRYGWGITAPASTDRILSSTGMLYNTTDTRIPIVFPVTMRTTPTLTLTGAASDYQFFDSEAVANVVATGISLSANTTEQIAQLAVTFTTPASAGARPIFLRAVNNANPKRLYFDAEL